jgi:hypothetical protein
MRTATYGIHDLQSKSSSVNDETDSESDGIVVDVGYCNNAEWFINGHKRNRFPAMYDAGTKGELEHKNSKEIYRHVLDDKICKITVQKTNIYRKQNTNKNTAE